MRLFGFVLLVAGLLLCVSIVWAALGFLMMGFGLICLLIAERNRQRAPKLDVSDLAAGRPIDAAPRPDKTVARQQPAVFLEPTFAAAPPGTDLGPQVDFGDSLVPDENWSLPVESAVVPLRVENGGDRRAPPPLRTTRSSEFDRIRALRAERGSVRSEPEFQDFTAPVEREPPPPTPLPAHSVSAEVPVQPPITVAPPIIAVARPIITEPKAAAKEHQPENASAKPVTLKAERSVLFDDADDLADLFNKFDLGKDEPAG
jgi:hypothetical protein